MTQELEAADTSDPTLLHITVKPPRQRNDVVEAVLVERGDWAAVIGVYPIVAGQTGGASGRGAYSFGIIGAASAEPSARLEAGEDAGDRFRVAKPGQGREVPHAVERGRRPAVSARTFLGPRGRNSGESEGNGQQDSLCAALQEVIKVQLSCPVVSAATARIGKALEA
jgi:hypothetical protein